MILSVNITEKSFGDKLLYDDLKFEIKEGEKVGLIGRNGTGKTSLLSIIAGSDKDFSGQVNIKPNSVLITSRQEHHAYDQQSALDYILSDLPQYSQLHNIISTYPNLMGSDTRKIQTYSDATERFSQLGYFEIENELKQAFIDYQLSPDFLQVKLASLSGGEKRLIELIKVQRSRGQLALIDEPTNHMDFIAKASFIKWFKTAEEAILVVTHDRDLLSEVDKIVEIRDGHASSFRGNYQHYLRVNTSSVTNQVNEFELINRRIINLRSDLLRYRRLKEKSRHPSTIKRFKSLEKRTADELSDLENTKKPSFWIDRENSDILSPKVSSNYQKYKAQNIRLDTKSQSKSSSRLLIDVHDLSLGYSDEPLFTPINFSLSEGERLRLHGRNGAGKTTLISELIAKISGQPQKSKILSGNIAVEREISLGVYDQEIEAVYLTMKLSGAIEHALNNSNVAVNESKIRKLLSDYLFDPIADFDTPIERLSGGQKARFQLIRMLANDPQLLILDEPTNHLDLPSIEELEDALKSFKGAVIYISHDSIFADRLGGETLLLTR